MRAVALDAGGAARLVDAPEPEGEGVLVHVDACGLCGSDVEKLGLPAYGGAVLGHEVAGHLDDGTRVTVLHRVSCGACARCLAGHESTCDEFAQLRIAPGGFAERLRATHFVEVSDTFESTDAIWIEPLACVLRAAARVPRGSVRVVGAGAMGLLWVQVLLARGDAVSVSEPRADRLARAVALGASAIDLAPDAVVLTAHSAGEAALAALEPGGTLLVFASAAQLPLDLVYRRELQVVGSRSATPASFALALDLLPSLELPPVDVLSLDRFDEGVDRYCSGAALKVVFAP